MNSTLTHMQHALQPWTSSYQEQYSGECESPAEELKPVTEIGKQKKMSEGEKESFLSVYLGGTMDT